MLMRVRKLLLEDSGWATLLVVGVVLVLTILGFAIMARSANEERITQKSAEGTRALHVADAGIQQAVWRVEQNMVSKTAPNDFSVVINDIGGRADVTVENAGGWYWTITSKGTIGNVSRTVKTTLFYFNLWETSMSTGEQGIEGGNQSGAINGNASFTGPLYVRGGFAVSGDATYEKGPLMIYDGSLQIGGSARVGSPDTSNPGWYGPIEAYIHPTGDPPVFELRRPDRPITSTNGPQFYAKRLTTNVPKITLPRMKSMDEYRSDASEQSVWTSETGSNTVYRRSDGSNPVNWNYDSGPYGEKVWSNGDATFYLNSSTPKFGFGPVSGVQISGTPKDPSLGNMEAIAWDPASRTLYLSQNKDATPMTVFVNGDLVIGDNQNSVTYFKGRGTLVVNGTITIHGRFVASNRSDFPVNPSTQE